MLSSQPSSKSGNCRRLGLVLPDAGRRASMAPCPSLPAADTPNATNAGTLLRRRSCRDDRRARLGAVGYEQLRHACHHLHFDIDRFSSMAAGVPAQLCGKTITASYTSSTLTIGHRTGRPTFASRRINHTIYVSTACRIFERLSQNSRGGSTSKDAASIKRFRRKMFDLTG
jgi:hypothetical protein